MRKVTAIALLVVVAAAALVGVMVLLSGESTDEPVEPVIVGLEDGSTGFYPYLNDATEFDDRSAINVIVEGEYDDVVAAMTDEPETELDDNISPRWIELDVLEAPSVEGTTNASATERGWSAGDGAVRYAYFGTDSDSGEWIEESKHLEDGEYFGYRYHVRLYEAPEDDAVLMQAHSEHFDWFTLRHDVDGIQGAQAHVEQDLMTLEGVDKEDVTRTYLGNTKSSDSDGWASMIDLAAALVAPLAIAMALSSRQRRLQSNHGLVGEHPRTQAVRAALLAVGIVGMVVFVRVLGLVLDAAAPFLSVHMIAAIGYPFVALGIPATVVVLASRLESPGEAAVVAFGAFGAAVWLEYRLLGVGTVPLEIITHRAMMALALGLLAAGMAGHRRNRRLLTAGATLWVIGLVTAAFALI